ncbi:noncanonical pyrimidine nucleotidase, YjjG family [Macrococcoides bohemicum]|uniref:YjjG family noncanonical pyrimidine nucleotidase n=1 Tax=Macrococcoides bohemicum TaxID=1903056 RepID=UPI00105A2A21|nr:YjjG family noncanonical pyrimidine nucleotidase [Macrococcus bohemicus]TDL38287.1 noncanonical pyrimidine nucleotidase, YjjG family [Macrococcus bohemicus]
MYKYVLIDLDNTLIDFNIAEKEALNKVFLSEQIELNDDMMACYKNINGKLWAELESGIITRKELLDTRFEKFFKSIGIEADGIEKEMLFREVLNNSHELIEDAEDLLQYLKAKGIITCSASNGVYHTQMQRMKASGIYKYFDYHFISEKIGYEKPDVRFFEHCFEALRIKDKAEVLMIGDTISSDIEGAKNAGIDSCYFGEQDVSATYTIRNLNDIKVIL